VRSAIRGATWVATPRRVLLGRPRLVHNVGVPTYVRWFWPDDRIWNYEELDPDRHPTRHVEIRDDGAFVAAASLAEILAARDSGEADAVGRYETRYGVVPDGPLPDQSDEWPLEPVSAGEFESLWRQARAVLVPAVGLVRCEAVEWVDTDWPGWIKVRLIDADGRPWYLIDKVPVFGGNLDPVAQMPTPIQLHCDLVGDDGDRALIVAPRWDVQAEDGTNQFRVRLEQFEPLGG